MPNYDADQWATTAEARASWPQAPKDEVALVRLLKVATLQCRAYAPVLRDDLAVPPTYTEAAIVQARDVWSAYTRNVSSDTTVGLEAYAVRVRSMSDVVKGLLRPTAAVPVLG